MPTMRKPALLVAVVDLVEPGDLGGAGQAPARPEDDQHDVAFEVGQAHGLAVEVGSLDRRGGLADHVELVEAAGAERLDGGVVGLLEHQLKGLARHVELVALDQPLVIGVADGEQGGCVETAGRSRCCAGSIAGRSSPMSVAQVGQRLVVRAPVGRRR